MNTKNRKQALIKLTKEAKQNAQLTKIAQEVESVSSSPDEYARNFLKKLLEQTDIHLVGEDEGPTV
jgi:hypothetical protein